MSCDAMDTTAPSVHVLKALIEQQYMPVIQRNAMSVPVSFHFARNQRQRRKYLARRRGGKS
jgi:hypothetical protein